MDWKKLQNEYVTKKITYKELCEKYGCTMSAITKYGAAHEWGKKRKNYCKKVERKTLEKTASRAAERESKNIDRCYELTEQLLDKLEQAIAELDKQVLTVSTKTKSKTYNDDKHPNKVTGEISAEKQELVETKSSIDVKRLNLIASALRDIRTVRTEKEDDGASNEIKVIIADDMLKYAE